jgi:hypothetical protein
MRFSEQLELMADGFTKRAQDCDAYYLTRLNEEAAEALRQAAQALENVAGYIERAGDNEL